MQEQLEATLLEVSKSEAIDAGDIQQAAHLILCSICKGLMITRCGIWLLDEKSAAISCSMLIDKGNDLTDEALILKREQFPNYFSALDTERAVAAHDAEDDPATREFKEVYLRPLGITSMLDSPIRHKGKMVGIICSEHQGEPRTWTDDEIVFAGAMADLYGRAISAKQRQHYEEELRQVNLNLESTIQQRTQDLEETLCTLKTAQDRLIESEKMAALGALVAGVAHEVNTPLGVAVTSVSHCLAEVDIIRKAFDAKALSKDQFDGFLTEILSALNLTESNLQRASQLISNFKRTAADQASLEKELIDLPGYLNQIVTPFSSMLRKQGVTLKLDLGENIPITTYPGAISQVITNLISNSLRHAFPETFTQEKQIEITCTLEATLNRPRLVFSDNGIGLDELSQKRIFEPFYTTARNRGGTGLGMSIIYNLITQKLNGEINVHSKQYEGLKVVVDLPMEL